MPMFFPGMDPYLEEPELWPGVHNTLIVYLRDQLQPKLAPRYVVAVEDRVYVEPSDRRISPDLWIRHSVRRAESGGTAVADEVDEKVTVRIPALEAHESYIRILDRRSGQRVVTVIEVLSPANKQPGPGRESYLAKQQEVFHSSTHLIEIDLLRSGEHAVLCPEWAFEDENGFDYLVCVSRVGKRPDEYDLYPRRLRDRLPRIGVPLADGDADAALDIQAAVTQTYEAGYYAARIDYSRPCHPRLAPDDQAWASQLAAAAGRV